MAKKIATIPFQGTAEQEQELRAAIDALRDDPEIYGYLPIEVQTIIAEELNVPLEKVFGVATFYAQFTMSPKGKYRISVCLGTACYVKGSGVVMEKIEKALGIESGTITPDGKFSLDDCRCVGACGLAPVVTINDDVYGRLTGSEKEIEEILAKYAD